MFQLYKAQYLIIDLKANANEIRKEKEFCM